MFLAGKYCFPRFGALFIYALEEVTPLICQGFTSSFLELDL